MTQQMMVTMQAKKMTISRSNITTTRWMIMMPNRQRGTTTMITIRHKTNLARKTRQKVTNRERAQTSLERVMRSMNPNLAKVVNPNPVNLATSNAVASQERGKMRVTWEGGTIDEAI
jgi:selenophosphate synthase